MKPTTQTIISDKSDRLDKIITENITNYSRGYISALIKSGNISVNNQIIYKPSYKVMIDDKIIINIPPPKELTLKPKKADLDIVYENKDILVINKPPKIAVHPGNGHIDNTIVNVILYHYPDFKNFDPINNIYRPGIVHRLDKDTSGLLVIAKNQATLNRLQRDIKKRTWIKKYQALVLNDSKKSRGVIEKNITRSTSDRKKFTITSTNKGKNAITHYNVINNYTFDGHNLSLVDVRIETGRTHQIRVHLFSEGMPIIGDQTYNTKPSQQISKKLNINRQLLHAYYLKINNPSTNRKKELKSPLPKDFANTLSTLISAKNLI